MSALDRLSPSDPYYRHWRLLTTVHRWALVGLAVFIAGSAVFLQVLIPRLGWVESEQRVLMAFALFVYLCALPIFARAGMRCPRCGKPYFQKVDDQGMKTWRSNTLSRRCLNCALPLWAPGQQAATDHAPTEGTQ